MLLKINMLLLVNIIRQGQGMTTIEKWLPLMLWHLTKTQYLCETISVAVIWILYRDHTNVSSLEDIITDGLYIN